MRAANTCEVKCLLCNYEALDLCYDGRRFMSVASDDKPRRFPAVTYFCRECGHLQKLRSADTQRELKSVYSNYDIYHLSSGAEQVIFQNGGQAPLTRSVQLIERLKSEFGLPHRG